jgi:phosphoglycolate phosphatase-like HAD superfamily hydrolase
MKAKILFLLVLMMFCNLFSQSDYEIVQNFKNRIPIIESKIKDAISLEDLQNTQAEVEKLKNDFLPHKELLDRSLYPENFQKIIDNLNNYITIRKGDFVQIEELQTEVVTLRTEIDELNKKNAELLNKIYTLELQRKKDAKTIERLQSLVAELRASLAQRDELVLAIIDSLMPKIDVDTRALTDAEKQNIASETESRNVVYLVKKSLRDNIRFLEITTLKPADIETIKKQQDNFVSLWQRIGPKLTDIYAAKPEKSNELRQIDALFTNWKNNLRREVWESIREDFSVGGISLRRFNSGEEFTNTISNYIDEEIKSYGVKSEEESKRVYSVFTDSIWFKTINTDWMPYLIDNKMITLEQKDLIDQKINQWKDLVAPSYNIWIYISVAAVLILIALIYFMRSKRKVAE